MFAKQQEIQMGWVTKKVKVNPLLHKMMLEAAWHIDQSLIRWPPELGQAGVDAAEAWVRQEIAKDTAICTAGGSGDPLYEAFIQKLLDHHYGHAAYPTAFVNTMHAHGML
jgi:hypothetical protein